MRDPAKQKAINLAPLPEQLREAVDWLKRNSNQASLDALERFAIPTTNAYGVAREKIKQLGKLLGRNHPLAIALWDTGVYETQMLATFVGDPRLLTPDEMDKWCNDVNNWAICDSLCFNFLDRSPHAWSKVELWSGWPGEFQKRTAFSLLWSLASHDKSADTECFLQGLGFIEREAKDERHFVKKAVNMALRAIGKRDLALNVASVKVAQRLAESEDTTARWVGRDALRELSGTALHTRLR
jgi:3-methyladenine DNA glycosylase AlkD